MKNTQLIDKLKDNKLSLKPAMNKPKGASGIFDSLLSVYYKETVIFYLHDNENGTFNTIELLNYPSSFPKYTFNNSIDDVLEILESVIENNFKTA